MTNPEVFDGIYSESMWGYKSGPGSDPEFASFWIDTVNSFLAKPEIVSVIDVGCGDWRIGKHLNLDGKDYTGVDISSVILEETRLNTSDNIKFVQGDFELLEIHDADLIIIKDVLQHLTNKSVYNIVNKIMKKSKYALFCDDMLDKNNNDIYAGEFRFLDLSAEPFNFKFKRLGDFGGKVISLYTRDEEANA